MEVQPDIERPLLFDAEDPDGQAEPGSGGQRRGGSTPTGGQANSSFNQFAQPKPLRRPDPRRPVASTQRPQLPGLAPWQRLGTYPQTEEHHHSARQRPGHEYAESYPGGATDHHHKETPSYPQHLDLRQEDGGDEASAGPEDYYVPVKAFFIARHIDTRALIRSYEGQPGRLSFKLVQRKHVVVRMPDRDLQAPLPFNPGNASAIEERWMVVFAYGSVVFLNFGDDELRRELMVLKRFVTEAIEKSPTSGTTGAGGGWVRRVRRWLWVPKQVTTVLKYAVEPTRETTDDYALVIRPTMRDASHEATDAIMLQELDESSVLVIAIVLAQSVALEFYTARIEGLLAVFGELNARMEATGEFEIEEDGLFKIVAMANTALADVVINLEILNRSEAAWRLDKYSSIWEIMREVFEMADRFETLSYKLNVVQTNIQFFLEVLQNKRSDFLEWIVIILIAVEILLGGWQIYIGAHGVP